jgi:chemotaxis protein histidine kinase CheA
MKVRVYTNTAKAIEMGREPARGYEWMEVDLSKLTETQRKTLATTGQDGSGDRTDGETIRLNSGAPTLEALQEALDKMLIEQQKRAAKEAEKLEKAVTKFLAMSQDEFNQYHIPAFNIDRESEALEDPRLAEKVAARNKFKKEEAELKRKNEAEAAEALKQAELKRKEKEAEERERRKQEQADWINQHGSERLKLAMKGGYPLQGLYYTERTAFELGDDWIYDTDKTFTNQDEDRANPSLEALELSASIPNSRIVWLADEQKEAVRVDLDWANHYIYKIMENESEEN